MLSQRAATSPINATGLADPSLIPPVPRFWERFRLAPFADLVKQTALEWMSDNAPRLGAALAFYSVLSAAPLLVISISIAGAFVDEETAQKEILTQSKSLLGEPGEGAIKEMLANMQRSNAGVWAGLFGVVTLLFGASGVFGELQATFNTIWDIPPKQDQTVWTIVKDRFFSFLMVLGTGFLLLVSLVVNAAVATFSQFVNQWMPGETLLLNMTTVLLSLAVTTLLFAFLFKHVPDVDIAWSDVLPGAVMTALLFSLGKTVLGLYLTMAGVGSAYGAAGSLVVLLIWIYYSAQILFFGAEFTQVYAKRYGTHRAANALASAEPAGRG